MRIKQRIKTSHNIESCRFRNQIHEIKNTATKFDLDGLDDFACHDLSLLKKLNEIDNVISTYRTEVSSIKSKYNLIFE